MIQKHNHMATSKGNGIMNPSFHSAKGNNIQL